MDMPSSPYAGTTCVANETSRSSGTALGTDPSVPHVVAVIGGIVAYAIGIAYVEQLGTRLVQAFGLLTALVGLIVLLATYGMNRATGPGEADGAGQA